jgi:hypothetical protein
LRCARRIAGAQIFGKICLGLCPKPRQYLEKEEDLGLLSGHVSKYSHVL